MSPTCGYSVPGVRRRPRSKGPAWVGDLLVRLAQGLVRRRVEVEEHAEERGVDSK